MSRTLFDADDAPEAGTSAPTPSRPRRDAIVPVRLTKGERDQLGEVARDLGICLSTYMRQAVLSRPLPPRRAARRSFRDRCRPAGRCARYPRSTARRITPSAGSLPMSTSSRDAWPNAVGNLARPMSSKPSSW